MKDVLTIVERVQRARAGFHSLTDAIDTTTPIGRMMMQMVGSFAAEINSATAEKRR